LAKIKRPKKYGRHSPAGYAWLMEQKKKKAETLGLSGRTRRELSHLSGTDRKAILEALKGKPLKRKR